MLMRIDVESHAEPEPHRGRYLALDAAGPHSIGSANPEPGDSPVELQADADRCGISRRARTAPRQVSGAGRGGGNSVGSAPTRSLATVRLNYMLMRIDVESHAEPETHRVQNRAESCAGRNRAGYNGRRRRDLGSGVPLMNPAAPRIFISYCHADERWKDRLLEGFRGLREAAEISVWQDREIPAGGEWQQAIRRAMDQAAVAICLISEHFLSSSFCTREEIPHLLELRASERLRLIPVLVRPCGWGTVWWLKDMQLLPRDGRSLEGDYAGREDPVLQEVIDLALQTLKDPQYAQREAPPPETGAPAKVFAEYLPTSDSQLFGRGMELTLLDRAWRGSTTMVGFVAGGGYGKSTLVTRWLENMKADHYRGADLVYGWSFYSQGTNSRVTSADAFFAHALKWFGDPEPTAGSAWSKGERLAQLAQQKRTLLVLDGLEPLQSPIPAERGRIKDSALETFVAELAGHNRGLCVITTRVKPEALEALPDTIFHDLERLPASDGATLLRNRGALPKDEKVLEDAAMHFGGHALALTLAAFYVKGIPGHDIQAAVKLPDVPVAETEGRPARKVMAGFAKRFGNGPEIRLLRILGLFDRPADLAVIEGMVRTQVEGASGDRGDAQRHRAAVPGLTDGLPALDTTEWLALVKKLRDVRLVLPVNGSSRISWMPTRWSVNILAKNSRRPISPRGSRATTAFTNI